MASGYSLHIGLNSLDPNHYDGWSGPLTACEADAAAMRKICERRGFAAETLLTRHATRDAVLQRLEALAGKLVSGDTLIVSYAGHGSQLPDANGDEDDGLDETLCLFDGQLLDDELYKTWARFASGVRIAVFSDSCHSGTVTRFALETLSLGELVGRETIAGTSRLMPLEIQARTYAANRDFYDALLARPAPPTPACTVLLVSGCQDNQESKDGAFNGKFTGTLIRVWDDARFTGGYEAFTKAIRKKMPSSQSPNFLAIGAPNPAFAGGQVFSI